MTENFKETGTALFKLESTPFSFAEINFIKERVFNLPREQICVGDMATVIGIFENQYRTNKPLTVVNPGTQTRRFTHISDTVEACYLAWKKNKCRHYSISNRRSYSIINVAKMFKSRIKYLPSRAGERYASALTNLNLSNKVYKLFGKIKLTDYIKKVINS